MAFYYEVLRTMGKESTGTAVYAPSESTKLIVTTFFFLLNIRVVREIGVPQQYLRTPCGKQGRLKAVRAEERLAWREE